MFSFMLSEVRQCWHQVSRRRRVYGPAQQIRRGTCGLRKSVYDIFVDFLLLELLTENTESHEKPRQGLKIGYNTKSGGLN